MAKYDIVGGIVSDAAMKQLQEIEKLATSIGKSLQGVKLSDISKGGKDAANLEKINAQTQLLIEKTKILEERRNAAASKRITETNDELKAMKAYYSELEKSSAKEAAIAQKAADEKRRAQEAVAAANEKARKSTADYKVGVSALSNVEKLKAVITSEHTSALQKLGAQMRLLEIEMQSKFNPALAEQSQEFRNLNAEHARLQQEYQRTARATGVMGRSLNSTYGSTFQLTQVMRELPNFAIDARVGFMALSNNLPMLADSFQQLRQQIIDTEGAAGATRKTWAAFGKSLLSLNTIMIVASTLLVLFGDDILAVFKNTEKANSEIVRMAKLISTIQTGTFDKMKSEMEKIVSFAIDYNKAVKDGNTDRIKQLEAVALKEYNIHSDRLKQIGENVNNWRFAFSEYLRMAQITYANEARIKAGADAEFELKKAQNTTERLKIEIRDKQKQKLLGEGYSEKDAEELSANFVDRWATGKIGGGEAFFAGFSKYVKEWNEANKLIKDSSNQLKDLKNIPIIPVKDLFETQNGTGTGNKTYRDKGVDMDYLTYRQPRPETITTKGIKMPAMASIFNIDAAAIDKVLSNTIEKYENGLITFQEFEADKNRLIQEAADKGVFITEENQNKIAQIIAGKDQIIKDAQIEALQSLVDNMAAIWGAYFDYMNEKLEEQADKQAKIEDEKYKDIEDREKAGIITKQEAEEEKLRTEAYYDSVQEEIDRKQKENDNRSFLIEQAAALAQVWINFGLATASLENMLLGGTLTPLYATIAGASSALILAQSIPAFEQGGVVAKDGTILAGEKRHELAILPDGSFFVTANKPTLYDVPKGTEIMPDLNKIDIMDILHLKPLYANHSDNKQTDALLRKIDNSIRNQKQGNFYGMPLIKQLDSRGRFDSRKKSLMN